jgi:RHS repeat-associated protein
MKRLIILLFTLITSVAPLRAAFDNGQVVTATSVSEQALLNGRVYDPQTGRFLSADVVVQDPNNLQSYNRYSYCSNNPMNRTDPSGYLTVIVPGTFNNANSKWVQPMVANLKSNGYNNVMVFDWSQGRPGGAPNIHETRVDAGAALANQINAWYTANNPSRSEPLNIIGYSHGGNVAQIATRNNIEIDTLVTLGTPNMSEYSQSSIPGQSPVISTTTYPYTAADNSIKNWVCIFDGNDGVQTFYANVEAGGTNLDANGHIPADGQVPEGTNLCTVQVSSDHTLTFGAGAHGDLPSVGNMYYYVRYLAPDVIITPPPPPIPPQDNQQ